MTLDLQALLSLAKEAKEAAARVNGDCGGKLRYFLQEEASFNRQTRTLVPTLAQAVEDLAGELQEQANFKTRYAQERGYFDAAEAKFLMLERERDEARAEVLRLKEEVERLEGALKNIQAMVRRLKRAG
jgi:wobble nucleotide-excising tRNase